MGPSSLGAERLQSDWIAVVNSLPIAIWTMRGDGTIEFVNAKWTDLTGFPPGAVLEDAWRRLIYPDDLGHVDEMVFAHFPEGKTFAFEFRALRADGTYAWLRAQLSPVRDERDIVIRWFGVLVDINELKRVQEALERHRANLEEAEERFRILAEAMPQFVWSALPDGAIDYFNQQWLDYTGLTAEDAAGRHLKHVVHPDDIAVMWEHWDRAIQTGEPYEIEYRLRRQSDNSYRWFLGRAMPVRDANGTIVRWIGTATDIDHQKRVEQHERHIAKTLQEASLPPALPAVRGLAFDAIYTAANQESDVGGDWYDAIELDDGSVFISVGDVMGKGIEAAVLMSKVRDALDVVPLYEMDPARILDAADWFLRGRYPDALVTAFVAVISADRQRIRYANAGHPFPLLRRDGTIEELRSSGLPLGLRSMGESQETDECAVSPGDILALFTDGLTEWGHDWAEGDRCLRRTVASENFLRHATPAQFLASACTSQPFRDDVAILTVSFVP